MENDSGVITFVCAAAAFIGPLVGVAIANTYARQESRRKETTEVFRHIHGHMSTFVTSARDELRHLEKLTVLLRKMDESRVESVFNEALGNEAYQEELRDRIVLQQESVDEINARSYECAVARRATLNELKRDGFSIDLTLGTQGGGCRRALESLVEYAGDFPGSDDRGKDMEYEQRLEEHVARVISEMKLSHDQIMKSDVVRE